MKALLRRSSLPGGARAARRPAPRADRRRRAPPRSASTSCCGCRGARRRVGPVLRLPPRGGRAPARPGANLAKILSTLGDRDLPVVARARLPRRSARRARTGASRRAGRRRAAARRRPTRCCSAWLGGIVARAPRRAPDVAPPRVRSSSRPLALLAARHRPPARVAGRRRASLVRAVPPRPRLGAPPPDALPRARRPRSSTVLRALPEGALAISDDPGIVWRAGRRTPPRPGRRVDPADRDGRDHRRRPSSTAAAAPDVCAVVVRSARALGLLRRPARAPRRRPATSVARRGRPRPRVPTSTTTATRAGSSTRRRRPRRSRWRRPGVRVDDRRERHPLGGQVEHDEHDEHAGADRSARLEHDRQAEHRAEQVGAGVAEHQPLAAGRRGSRPAAAPTTGASASPTGDGAGRQRDRHVGEQPDLDRAARAPGRAGCRGWRPARPGRRRPAGDGR